MTTHSSNLNGGEPLYPNTSVGNPVTGASSGRGAEVNPEFLAELPLGHPLAESAKAITNSESKGQQPLPQGSPTPKSSRPKRVLSPNWSWLVPLLVAGTTAAGASLWIASVPPVPDCKRLWLLSADADQLYCADQAARTGNLQALVGALNKVSRWSKDHPLYNQSEQFAKKWSGLLMVIARQQAEQGNLQQAIDLVKKIPNTTAVYPEAKTLLAQLEENADEGKSLFKAVNESMRAQDWPRARAEAKALSQLGNSYWQGQAQKLLEQIAMEQQAEDQLVRAERLVSYKTALDLVDAIKLVNQINPKALVYAKSQEKLKNWTQELLAYATERQQAGDLEGAIKLLSEITPDANTSGEARNLMQLGKAQKVASEGNGNFFSTLHAWSIAQQIPADNAMPALVKAQLNQWEQQIQNIGQLQVAKLFAGIQQVVGYQAAIAQAQLISTNQSGYSESQSLISQWRRQLSLLRDQPIFNAALALGNQKQFQRAIQIAQLLGSDSSLLGQAQQQIWRWTGDMQAVVDRPILDQAIALANQGQLTEAIRTAAQIGSDRVLYQQAQNYIGDWLRQREAIEAARRPRSPEPIPEASPEPAAAPPEPPPQAAQEPPPAQTPSPELTPITPEPSVEPLPVEPPVDSSPTWPPGPPVR